MTERDAADALSAARARVQDFCRMLGIERPVLNAPMPQAAGPELAAQVSEAGGLGVLSGAGLGEEDFARAVLELQGLTQKPFAIHLELPGARPSEGDIEKARRIADGLSELLAELGLPDPASPEGSALYDFTGEARRQRFVALFARVLELRPAAVITTCGGLREPEAEALAAAGILNIGTATTLRETKVLSAAGCSAIVAQGSEAAGPRSSFEDSDDVLTGLTSLVPAAARATGLPVIAAGGICSGSQALGLSLMGASAVMLGTAFLSTRESVASPHARQAACWASAGHLTLTRLYSGRLTRALKSPLLDALEGYAAHLPAWPAHAGVMAAIDVRARALGRDDLEAVFLGQSAGRSAAADAASLVREVSQLLG